MGGCAVHVRWKDSCAYGIERVGGGDGDGVARECLCTRVHACARGIQAMVTDNGQTQAFVAMRSACTALWGILQTGHSRRGSS